MMYKVLMMRCVYRYECLCLCKNIIFLMQRQTIQSLVNNTHIIIMMLMRVLANSDFYIFTCVLCCILWTLYMMEIVCNMLMYVMLKYLNNNILRFIWRYLKICGQRVNNVAITFDCHTLQLYTYVNMFVNFFL